MSSQVRREVRDPGAFGKVAVLLGGESSERDISLVTGEAVHQALLSRGVDATALDVPASEVLGILQAGAYDRVWNALHGGFGENGALQGLLACARIPFTGSGVLASALGLDKLRSKYLFESAGLKTPAHRVLQTEADLLPAAEALGLPMAIKPNAEGSSVGVARVSDVADLPRAFAEARRYDELVLAEQWVDGDEYTAAILQGETLPLVRIEAASGFYDYTAKYHSEQTRYHVPCGLSADVEAKAAAVARRAFEAIGASGWGRVDLMLAKDGTPLVLEVNTVPGMTHHSLVPMAAAAHGIEFAELVWRVLETSMPRTDEGTDDGKG